MENEHTCRSNQMAFLDAIELINGKWRVPILLWLSLGELRFNGLLKVLPGLSSKVLASELNNLETNQLITREVLTGKPVQVVYKLTDYAKELNAIINELVLFGKKHRSKIHDTWSN